MLLPVFSLSMTGCGRGGKGLGKAATYLSLILYEYFAIHKWKFFIQNYSHTVTDKISNFSE